MRKFKDSANREWEISLPIGTVIRVKQESSGRFDLFDASRASGGDSSLPLSTLLATDLAEFWELLWHLVSDQAKAASVDAKQFGKDMAGDCLLTAQECFFDEWRDFFRLLQRHDQALIVEKTILYVTTALERIKAKATEPEIAKLDEWVTTQMEKDLNESFGNLLASAESTHGRSRSDSFGT